MNSKHWTKCTAIVWVISHNPDSEFIFIYTYVLYIYDSEYIHLVHFEWSDSGFIRWYKNI